MTRGDQVIVTYVYSDAVRANLFLWAEVNLSHVFAGQNVGVTQVGERLARYLHALRFGLLRR
jgi:hypothetical protein